MRLSNGNRTAGRVEMLIGRFWATVCNDNWVTESSNVLCRQLGLGSAGVVKSFGAGPPSVPVILDNVVCNGSEPNILACSHSRLGSYGCSHSRDVGVVCSGLYG